MESRQVEAMGTGVNECIGSSKRIKEMVGGILKWEV